MKHEIVISNEIPDYVKIEMLESLIKMIKEKKEDFSDISFKTNLQIDYTNTKEIIKAEIMGNVEWWRILNT